jgi:8-oxo-dGTP diphosphatase
MADKPRVVVTAAVIERDGAFLVTRRPAGAHLEGDWEFPGGKCDGSETLENCLRREIREELAADAIIGERIFSTAHEYPERVVVLHFFACELRGEARAVLGQEMQWAKRERLRALRFPPADDELIERLVTVS